MIALARISAGSTGRHDSASCAQSPGLPQGAELTGDIKRLQGSNEYRLRVGDWRARFEREDRLLIITVVRVVPRGRAYDR
jgi:hypothetical protein